MLISQQKYFTKPPVIPPIRYFLTQTLTVLLCSSDETLAVEPRGNGTSYKTFIDLLTTVHFISVLTAFATYFGVIQRDWHSLPLGFFFFLSVFSFYIYMFLWEMLTASAAQCTNQNYSSSSSSFLNSDTHSCKHASFRRSFPCARKRFHDSPLGGRQTFSRNIDKIQMKKKKRGGEIPTSSVWTV